eukprot:1586043-Pyramimonas_sp.AAC.1
MRILAGGPAGAVARPRSYMVRRKLAVHMVLTGKPIRCWAALPDWGLGRNDGALSRETVRELLRRHGPEQLTSAKRRLLTAE